MRTKSNHISRVQTTPEGYGGPGVVKVFRPLSQYIAGAADIDGDALRDSPTAPMSEPADDSENVDVLLGEGVISDPFCDPRVDHFTLSSFADNPRYAKMIREEMQKHVLSNVESSDPASGSE